MSNGTSSGRVVQRASATLIFRVIGAISGLGFSYSVTRVLSVDDAGVFFFGFAIVSVLWNVSSMGMPLALLRFVSIHESNSNQLGIAGVLNFAIRRVFALSCVVAVVVWLLSGQLSMGIGWTTDGEAMLRILTFAIPMIAISNLFAYAFQGLHKTPTSIILQHIVTPLGSSMMLGFLLLVSYTIDLITVGYVLSAAAGICLVVAVYLWSTQTSVHLVGVYFYDKEFVRSAGRLYVSSLMGLLVLWSSLLIAGALLSSADVAYLAIAQRLAMLTSFFLMAINLVVAPKFAASYADRDLDELRRTSLLGSRLMLLSAVPMLVVMMAFPEWLMGLFGQQYVAGAHLLQILAVGQFINVSTGSVGFLLNMTGHERDMRNVTLVSGTLSLLLALLLTWKYGVTGAAVSASIACAGQNLTAAYFVKLRLGINTLRVF